MALPWYPVHVDRIYGSRRWRSVSGNAKGLWSNLMHLAWSTAEGRRTGRLVKGHGVAITVEEIRDEFNYLGRLDRFRALVQELIATGTPEKPGLLAQDPKGVYWIPRFPALTSARIRGKAKHHDERPDNQRRHDLGHHLGHLDVTGGAGNKEVTSGFAVNRTRTRCSDKNTNVVSTDPREATPKRRGDSLANLKRLVEADLENLQRLLALRKQAPAGFPNGQAGTLLWVACAVHARRVGRNPIALFRCLVDKTKCGWATVCQEDEDRARAWMRKEAP